MPTLRTLFGALLGLSMLTVADRPASVPAATPPPPGPSPPGPAPEEPARDMPKAQGPASGTGWWSKPAPEKPVLDVPEAVVLERLRQRGETLERDKTLNTKGVPALLRGLGRPTASPDAIHELILWLEFDETWFDPATGELDTKPRFGSANLMPCPMEDNPAVVALVKVGEPAVPQLVNEYLHFFENTSREAWHNRCKVGGAIDKNLDPLPVQDPGWRLHLIWAILTHRPEVSRRAVEHALARAKDAPEDDHLQRASQDLIRGIVAHYDIVERYSPDKLAKLFPPDALRKD